MNTETLDSHRPRGAEHHIRMKFFLFIISLFLIFVSFSAIAVFMIGEAFTDLDRELRGRIENGIDEATRTLITNQLGQLVQRIDSIQIEKPALSGDERLEIAKELVRTKKYVADGYFFMFDYAGNCIAHGADGTLEGTNMCERRDKKGELMVQRMAAAADSGGGYVLFDWQKPGDVKGEEFPKLGYGLPVRSMGLWVGTGAYLPETPMKAIIKLDFMTRTAEYLTIAALLLAMLLLVLNFGLAYRIPKRINELASWAQEISRRNYNIRIRHTENDEIAAVEHALEELASDVAAHTEELANQEGLVALGYAAAEIAHEFSNTIQQAKAPLDICRDFIDRLDKETVRKYVLDAEAALVQMSEYIELSLSTVIGKGRQTDFTVDAIVDDVYRLVHRRLEANGISAVFDPARGDALVTGDRSQLIVALNKLVENAIEALSEVKTRKLFLGITSNALHVRITIEDSGPGIPTGDLTRIFERGFTTKGDQGRGLGLAIAKHIVVRGFGGSLTAENGAVGARFTVELPRANRTPSIETGKEGECE